MCKVISSSIEYANFIETFKGMMEGMEEDIYFNKENSRFWELRYVDRDALAEFVGSFVLGLGIDIRNCNKVTEKPNYYIL